MNTADAREAVSTANNFRQRHGEEVAKGWGVGQGLNKKYGIANKMQGYAEGAGQSSGERSGQEATNTGAVPETSNPWASQVSAGFKKKAPPPPVPMGTKPR